MLYKLLFGDQYAALMWSVDQPDRKWCPKMHAKLKYISKTMQILYTDPIFAGFVTVSPVGDTRQLCLGFAATALSFLKSANDWLVYMLQVHTTYSGLINSHLYVSTLIQWISCTCNVIHYINNNIIIQHKADIFMWHLQHNYQSSTANQIKEVQHIIILFKSWWKIIFNR